MHFQKLQCLIQLWKKLNYKVSFISIINLLQLVHLKAFALCLPQKVLLSSFMLSLDTNVPAINPLSADIHFSAIFPHIDNLLSFHFCNMDIP